jgi:hypothetical protein
MFSNKKDDMAALLRCVVRAMLSPLLIETQSSKNEDSNPKLNFM